jgi:hypothetical protein
MKPKLLNDVIRQSSPRKFYGNGNRYNVLRDASVDSVRSNLSFRSRSQSIKRKSPDDDKSKENSYASVASVGLAPDPVPAPTPPNEVVMEKIVKVRSICDKIGSELSGTGIDPALIPVFSLINEAILGICDTQQAIAEGNCNSASPTVNINTQHEIAPSGSQKRSRQDIGDLNFVDLRTLSQRSARPAASAEDQQVKEFKEAVRDAEKSTLIFNLNLGTVPLINKDTMSTKVTKALQEKAAKKEGKNTSIPSNDTILAIDDVLSIVKGMNFYGKTTKSYSNPRDKSSGAYCTIPVRYDFTDKESRIYAESVLRDKCKVSCTTPYPLMLRETIKQIVEQTKAVNPGHFVKVNVYTDTMTLRVSKRPMLAEGDKGKKTWSYVGEPIPIPTECLDLKVRTVPKDYVVNTSCSMELCNEELLSQDAPAVSTEKTKSGQKSPTRRGSNSSQK